MTNQEAFTKAVLHVMRPEKQSSRPSEEYSGGRECLYRTSDGNSCAIGCLLPDELVPPNENPDVYGLLTRAGVAVFFAEVGRPLLSQLQRWHDGIDGRDLASKNLLWAQARTLAREYQLEMPERP